VWLAGGDTRDGKEPTEGVQEKGKERRDVSNSLPESEHDADGGEERERAEDAAGPLGH
jgi:hypothetical protein